MQKAAFAVAGKGYPALQTYYRAHKLGTWASMDKLRLFNFYDR